MAILDFECFDSHVDPRLRGDDGDWGKVLRIEGNQNELVKSLLCYVLTLMFRHPREGGDPRVFVFITITFSFNIKEIPTLLV